MSHFTPDDVRRLARLARLELDAADVTLFARQLGDILEFARQVQAVDTSGVSTLAGSPAGDALREDTVRPSLPHEEATAAAPAVDPPTGLFTVPRVIAGS